MTIEPGELPEAGSQKDRDFLDKNKTFASRIGPARFANDLEISVYVEDPETQSGVTFQWFKWNATDLRWDEVAVRKNVKGDGFKAKGVGLVFASCVQQQPAMIRSRWRHPA